MSKEKRSAINNKRRATSDERRTKAIHQLVPGMNLGDAITNHALEIQKILRKWGYDSNIYSVMRHVSPHMKSFCLDYKEYPAESCAENVMIYHFAIGSELTDYFKQLENKKVMIYHNITPEIYYGGINEQKAQAVREGREQLKGLVGVPELSMGVSEFNRQELVDLGFQETEVFSLIFNPSQMDQPKQMGIVNEYQDGKKNLLFVGRMAPNKKIEDIIRIFYYYQKTVQPHSRLLLVGSFNGMEKYHAYLKAYAMELGVKDVVFTDHVSDAELKTYYRIADLFICMSEHEGFCIPLLEAIYFELPILAYDAGAIAETLNGAGVLVKKKEWAELAEMVEVLMQNDRLRKEVIEIQKERLKAFSPERAEALLKKKLGKVLS